MEFFGLLGEKLGHSLSPQIHKLILEYIKEEGAYKLFEVERENLTSFTEALKVLKVKGSNVTIPYKQEIMKSLDNISDEANRIGAVNTITLANNKLQGDNTDYFGFGYMLEIYDVEIADKVCVILGNGGACKAIAYYLLDNGAKEIYICSRNPKENNYKDSKIKLINYDKLKAIKGDILINSTPVGMYPNISASPVDEAIIINYKVLVDIIYNPELTEFLKIGKENNLKIVGGLEMLIGQAVKAEEIWHNRKIDKEVISYVKDRLRL